MIPFDPNDPFPFYEADSYSYDDAKAHAIEGDQWLGLQVDAVEKSIRGRQPIPGTEDWSWLSPQSFMTPYLELRSILELLDPPPGSTLVDLGCAYARMGFVMARYRPRSNFVGYELVPERATEAARLLADAPNVRVVAQDLVAEGFRVPRAEYYFIYDFGAQPAISQILDQLRELARNHPIVVVARGRGVRQQIHSRHPWLAEVQEPRHFQHFSIYRS